MKLVDEGVLTLNQLIEKMALNPSRILGIRKGTLMLGGDADLVILDAYTEYTVAAANFRSKGKNTPFEGWKLTARPVATIAKGRIYTWE
jgi:dihydroorotase